jgi:SAM-dependent methyltransferase
MTASLRLENHDASMTQLDGVMQRVKADMSASRFLEVIAIGFQDVQASLTGRDMDHRFRSEQSYQDFQRSLQVARERCRHPVAVLAVGCGRGVAGQEATFAASVVKDVFGTSKLTRVDEYNLTSTALEQGFSEDSVSSSRPYDLIVLHSVLHYTRYLEPVFTFIQSLLKHSGGVILSHEPNARFWQTAACQDAIRELNDSRKKNRKLRYLKPAYYLSRLRARNSASTNMLAALNLELRGRFGFQDDLTELEMRRIVDIHRPAMASGDFKIGLDGLDLESLVPRYLPGMLLRWAASSGHLGYNDSRSLSRHWQRREQQLRNLHPLSGSVFTGYWSRR